jgi:peptide/nickel transport system ATP-binding protein
MPEASLLSVRDLAVEFPSPAGAVRAVDGVSFDVRAGEVLAIVGESGCGKSVTAQAVMGLTRAANARVAGEVRYGEEELLTASEERLRALRGAEIAMVFQDPVGALHPLRRIGWQIAEQVRAHQPVSAEAARRRAVELLGEVGIPAPAERADAYPHELSGGMCQRAVIAMALANRPRILIADEPTTALDVTVQAQILALIERLRGELGSVVLITHDLGVVAEIADRVLVMYAGTVVEQGAREEVFYDPQHPYTWGLLGSVPRPDRPSRERLVPIAGAPPAPAQRPPGCPFRPRCPHAFERCPELPPLADRLQDATAHLDRCWLDPADKRARRTVGGRIGLGADAP